MAFKFALSKWGYYVIKTGRNRDFAETPYTVCNLFVRVVKGRVITPG